MTLLPRQGTTHSVSRAFLDDEVSPVYPSLPYFAIAQGAIVLKSLPISTLKLAALFQSWFRSPRGPTPRLLAKSTYPHAAPPLENGQPHETFISAAGVRTILNFRKSSVALRLVPFGSVART